MEKTQNLKENMKLKIDVSRRVFLIIYDMILLIITEILVFGAYLSEESAIELNTFANHVLISSLCVFFFRYLAGIYKLIWRYVKSAAFIRLMISDTAAGILYYLLMQMLPVKKIAPIHLISIIALNLLLTIGIRLAYQYLYERSQKTKGFGGFFGKLIKAFTGITFDGSGANSDSNKIRIAIVGAGHVGVMLADELLNSGHSPYLPCCFIDIDRSKVGREIFGVPVLPGDESSIEKLALYGVQEIVFALPSALSENEKSKRLYEHYKKTGCKIKLYDYPIMQSADNGRRHLRDFDIEDLLFRKEIRFHDDNTKKYYKNKIILITGGGGSIGSELCRQIAKMEPKKIVVLDICENGAYDIEQELKIMYGGRVDVSVEIISVCDPIGLEKVFDRYRPGIVFHAAAHKHVPLMEHNICEAVKNNVFGTLNMVELSEKYNVERFIMISTDKAVNPTNVMGATKRMCEMLVQSFSLKGSSTVYSVTRFGNVLGSNGSVIPLFKKQIMNGGPITITDKRIIRYFMTIPEASQLVLQSGRLAKNGELFVLEMGKPIKILELAESMIRLSGYEPYRDIDIVETGLRPGEKLYEELLVHPDELTKTENDLIFVERVKPLPIDEVKAKLEMLRCAVDTGNDSDVQKALAEAVPTYKDPDDVNRAAEISREMELAEV